MAGKRNAAGAEARKGGTASAAAAPSSGERQGAPAKSRGRRGSGGWPWWLWVVGGFCLVACVGRFFSGEADGGRKGSDSKADGKKGGRKGGKSGENAASTKEYLSLALRLSQMTQVATTLQINEQLEGEAATLIAEELDEIEREIQGFDDSTARDLLSMVSVVRGTLFKHTQNLTDEEVEALGSSYTYSNPRYWDEYYKKTAEDERFDWYGGWNTVIPETMFNPFGTGEARPATRLGDLLHPYLQSTSRILMLGCGNSDLSEQMYEKGFQDIINIDISQKLIDNMQAKLQESMPRMRWMYMNASNLTFAERAFDVTLDKGTLDAVEQNAQLLHGVVGEVHRTLRPGGFFISVTYNPPSLRVNDQIRQAAKWGDCYSHPFEKPASGQSSTTYHVHICVRP